MFDDVVEIMQAMDIGLENLIIKEDILKAPLYDCVFTVEKVNSLVMQGMPFREAYQRVGTEVESGTFVADKTLMHSHQGSLGNLCNHEIKQKFEDTFNLFDKAKVNTAKQELLRNWKI
jgi:argininosuccinate lyase